MAAPTTHPRPADLADQPYSLVGRSHVPPLDGIRGVAVGLVMVRHFLGQNWEPAAGSLDNNVLQIARLGSNGVDMFFVLSGFLITGILLDTKDKPGFFKNFYMRRTLRIFPLYYLALLIAFFVWPHLAAGRQNWVVAGALEHKAWYWLYASNVLFAMKQAYVGLAHFWSLAVEEQFYMFWPLVVFMLNRKQVLWACGACVVIAMATRVLCAAADLNTLVAYVLTPGRVDALAIGAAIAAIARGPGGVASIRHLSLPLLLASGLGMVAVVYLSFGQGRTHVVNVLAGSLAAVFFGAVLLLAVSRPRGDLLPRVFCLSPLLILGKYSYCLYVCHPFVQEFVEWYWKHEWFPLVGGSRIIERAAFTIVCGGLSLLVSLISWHVFEKHWLKLKKYF